MIDNACKLYHDDYVFITKTLPQSSHPSSILGSTIAIFSCCNERWTLATFLTIVSINEIHSQLNLPPQPLWRKRYIIPPSRLHRVPAINRETRQNLVLRTTGSLSSKLTPNLSYIHAKKAPLRWILLPRQTPATLNDQESRQTTRSKTHTHSRPLATFSFTITNTPLHSLFLTRVHIPCVSGNTRSSSTVTK